MQSPSPSSVIQRARFQPLIFQKLAHHAHCEQRWKLNMQWQDLDWIRAQSPSQSLLVFEEVSPKLPKMSQLDDEVDLICWQKKLNTSR